jgi:hypothetical protein
MRRWFGAKRLEAHAACRARNEREIGAAKQRQARRPRSLQAARPARPRTDDVSSASGGSTISGLLFGESAERVWARARSLFVPTVSVVAIGELIGIDKADEAAQQLYDWERDRLFTLAKGLGAAAIGVVTTLLVDAAENTHTNSLAVWLAALFALMLLAWGGFILTGLRRLAEEYPVALKMLEAGSS